MSETMLSPVKFNLLRTIAHREGITDCEIHAKIGSTKGDGYLSIINIVTITDRNKSKRDLNLILKSSLTSEKLRQQAPIRAAYEREILLYQTIFPLFDEFADQYRIDDRFNEIAKCYDTLLDDGEECLVLANLKECGYQLWNRMVPMDRNHIELAFRTYGKLHGTALALKTLQPERFEGLSKNLQNIFKDDDPEKGRLFEEAFKNAFRVVAGREKATNALAKLLEDAPEYYRNLKEKPDKDSVITHGDCWCNNMMFKYEDSKNPDKPTKMCLLDWQISSYGLPVFDLSYCFFASASKQLYADIDEFLLIYHNSLANILKQAGCDPDEVLSYQQLLKQWKCHCKYGLMFVLFAFKFILADVEDAPDLTQIAAEDKDIFKEIVGSKTINEELYLERIGDVINFVVDRDYI